MRLPHWAALAAAFVLSGCFDEHALPETLMFPPGIDIEYLGKPAKLYGTSQCAQGQLTGNSCLIFPPPHTKNRLDARIRRFFVCFCPQTSSRRVQTAESR